VIFARFLGGVQKNAFQIVHQLTLALELLKYHQCELHHFHGAPVNAHVEVGAVHMTGEVIDIMHRAFAGLVDAGGCRMRWIEDVGAVVEQMVGKLLFVSYLIGQSSCGSWLSGFLITLITPIQRCGFYLLKYISFNKLN